MQSLQDDNPRLQETLGRASNFLNLVALLTALLSAVAIVLGTRSFAAWGAHRWPAEEWRHAQRQGRMHRHHWPRLRQRQCPSLAVFRPIRQIPTPINQWIALLISEH